MPFLKKITGSGNSHSRSASSSSVKTWSQESPSSSSNKHSSWLPPVSSKKRVQGDHRAPAANRDSYSNADSAPIFGRSSAEYDEQLGGSEESESTSPHLWAAGASAAPWSEEEASISRKLSGDSSNSLSFAKLILSWDPTDPEEWNPQRVTSWLKFHDFPESWFNLFKKYQLSGQRFIRLLAYDNFVIYEKYLPQTKNASYSRFQYLLKKTMKKNVINNHIRQKSADKARDVRSSSEYLKPKYNRNKSQEDVGSSRSASESALSPSNSAPIKREDKNEKADKTVSTPTLPLRAQKHTKSTGSLYRRSFISIRGSSENNSSSSKPPSSIRLNIPAAAHSASVSKGDSAKSLSPSSPSYSGIFKRHQKSSSSESSLLNTLFGPASGNVPPADDHSDKVSHLQVHNSSNESLPKSKIHLHETNSSSPLKQSPVVSEEKNTLWAKWRRKSQISTTGNNSLQSQPSPQQSIPHSTQFLTDSPFSTKANVTSIAQSSVITEPPLLCVKREEPFRSSEQQGRKDGFNITTYLLDKKFYPLRNNESLNDSYILITKDNKSFLPLNLSMITTLEEFKDAVTFLLEIYHKNITIHMTDFGCEIGSALPDDMLETLRSSLFLNTAGKLFIKDQSNPSTLITKSKEASMPASIKPKNSVKSVGSNITASTDDVSIVTSSSDISVLDAQKPEPPRKYPQTPSAYFEPAFSNGHASDSHDSKNSTEQVSYFNLKDGQTGSNPSIRPKIPHSSSSSYSKAPSFAEKDRTGTFHVLRKDFGNEIDFNKRRESPYVQPELAPKREAPKPPTNGSPQRSLSISSQVSGSHLRRDGSNIHRSKRGKKIMPPSPAQGSTEESSPVSENIVNSYTPGSSHVLVPQPYKGASDSPSRSKMDEDQFSPPALLAKQRLGRSDSFASTGSPAYHNPSSLLKRGSTKRIVSSASAADVFEENDVTFADAPALSDSDDVSDESSSSDTIIWSNGKHNSDNSQNTAVKSQNSTSKGSRKLSSEALDTMDNGLERKMTLRPSPEVVYQNLEKFFPHANLDKPVLEGVTPPNSPRGDDNYASASNFSGWNNKPLFNPSENVVVHQSVLQHNSEISHKPPNSSKGAKFPKRAKTIRTIAHEASEKRKQSMKLKRQNTKMWGTRTVEVTDKRLVSINKTKNSKGEYKEFAWIKGEMIGKGSFGAVFLCLNVTTGEMMAVKQVEVPKYGSQNEAIVSTVEALRAEVSTLKDLDHLNIVQYLGFEIKDSIYSLFLEYVAGGSVGSLIRMYGKFDETMIKHLTIQVLRGLSYLHSRGILHRDMKADNLLLDQDGVCKISDFGISRKSKDIYSNSEMTMRGTVFWMAPEMVDTKQGYSAKVDIWSLGCVVLEMFAGKRPWSNLEVVAAMFKIGKSKSAPPIPDDTLPLISQNGRDFLDQCFKIDPEERPTPDKLSSHPFLNVNSKYDFKSTKLAEFIKSNDKLNSTKLRTGSHEKGQANV